MEFTSEVEEEQYFPYLNMSLEDARLIRYLVRNMEVFKEHEIVKMSLKNVDNTIKVNGSAYKEGDNLTFDGMVMPRKTGYVIALVVEKVLAYEDYYSVESFRFNKNGIKVRSKIEEHEEIVKEIPYMDREKSKGIS